jgi:metal-dependent HD superfamily phosphatase/phosphodiesterase
MMKTAFVLAAATAVLTTSPPATPAKAQDLKMAQGVDIQIGRDRYDRDRGRDDIESASAQGVSPSAHDTAVAR